MMNVIGGLPRSGSTLFCNILNQNPKFFASSTSILPMILANFSSTCSGSIEVRAELRDREKTENKILRVARAICYQWYAEHYQNGVLPFDKSRAWNSNLLMLRTIFPRSKAIVLVRDLRNVFASVEKQHRKNGLLEEVDSFQMKQMETRANQMFSPTGLIGGPLNGIRDIVNRQLPVFFIRYEDFLIHTEEILKMLYQHLEVEEFNHNLGNIVNTATDPDWLYLYKYPHVGAGELKRQVNATEWNNYFSEDFANRIVENNLWFFEKFGYLGD